MNLAVLENNFEVEIDRHLSVSIHYIEVNSTLPEIPPQVKAHTTYPKDIRYVTILNYVTR